MLPEEVFRARLKSMREAKGMSQAAFAEAMSRHGVRVYASTIAKIEARDTSSPRAIRLNEAWAAAQTLGVELSDMLIGDDSLYLVRLKKRELDRQVSELEQQLRTKQHEQESVMRRLSSLLGVDPWTMVGQDELSGGQHGEHLEAT